MYAIIKSGSRQYRVQPQAVIQVNSLGLEAGSAFETDQVLLVNNEDKDIQVGVPFVKGAKVKGTVLGAVRGAKVLVFKMKRRKNYRRTRGHRQELTRIRIDSIDVGAKAAKPKAEKPASEAGAE
ncbi:MAG: 50S ribosomal protein L21 [Deltaproteobacteria bacterium]|nr:50S ribosomal protein L21 [Deltaproteobacteria bacterium]